MGDPIKCPKCSKDTVVNLNGMVRQHAKKMSKRKTDFCVASGKNYISLIVLGKKAKPRNMKKVASKKSFPLSARQAQVLDMLVKGFSHKKAGYILNISHRTVDNHVAKIKTLLKSEDRYDMLRWGKRNLTA